MRHQGVECGEVIGSFDMLAFWGAGWDFIEHSQKRLFGGAKIQPKDVLPIELGSFVVRAVMLLDRQEIRPAGEQVAGVVEKAVLTVAAFLGCAWKILKNIGFDFVDLHGIISLKNWQNFTIQAVCLLENIYTDQVVYKEWNQLEKIS